MGEYEERYPEAYGRGEPQPAGEEAPKSIAVPPGSDRPPPNSRVALGTPTEPPLSWQHAPNPPARTIEPAAPANAAQAVGSYRGVGPRGYARAPQRIYEDACDRLTDNPFIDASAIEVSVNGAEISLAGSVDSALTRQQVEAIAVQVIGVDRVRNRLIVRAAGDQRFSAAGDQLSRTRGAAQAR
jgi:hypothetical protein